MKILALILLPLFVLGQELVPFKENNLWGYKDTIGNIVIKPEYEFAKQHIENYAIVAQNGLFGAIDKYNNQIIEPKYELLKYGGKQRFLFGSRAKYFGEYNLGIINSKNEVLVQPEYSSIRLINNLFIVDKKSSELIDSSGVNDTRKISTKYGIVDTLGNIIFEPKYSMIRFLSNGYIKISDQEGTVLYDEKFNQLTANEYKFREDYHNGLLTVEKNNKLGYINLKGELEIECKYDWAYIFVDSLAVVRKDNKCGLINTDDKLVIDFKFKNLGVHYKNQIAVYDSVNWGMIDLKSQTLLQCHYDQILSEIKGITAFYKDNKWRIWDYKNFKLFKQEYDELSLLECREDTKFGTRRIEKKKYSQSIALVRIENNWGIVNEHGDLLVPIKYKKREVYKYLETL